MRRVLENEQSVSVGEGTEGAHVGELSVEVNRENADRSRPDSGPNGARIDETGRRLDVDENGHRADMKDRGCRGSERHGSGHDLVSRTDPERPERHDQSRCARIDTYDLGHHRVSTISNKEPPEFALEGGNLRPQRQE